MIGEVISVHNDTGLRTILNVSQTPHAWKIVNALHRVATNQTQRVTMKILEGIKLGKIGIFSREEQRSRTSLVMTLTAESDLPIRAYFSFSTSSLILSKLAPENSSTLAPFLKNKNVGMQDMFSSMARSSTSSTSTLMNTTLGVACASS